MGCSGLAWGPACAPPSVTCFHDRCPHLVGDDRDYEYDVDTSRLVPSCPEHSGRLGPLACQVEIFLTLSGIYRYLGRLNTVLGVVLIKLLQCRHVPGVVVLIMLLQCRYHYHLFIQLLPHTYLRQMASQDIVWSGPAGSTEDACNTRCRLQCRMRSLSRPLAS